MLGIERGGGSMIVKEFRHDEYIIAYDFTINDSPILLDLGDATASTVYLAQVMAGEIVSVNVQVLACHPDTYIIGSYEIEGLHIDPFDLEDIFPVCARGIARAIEHYKIQLSTNQAKSLEIQRVWGDFKGKIAV